MQEATSSFLQLKAKKTAGQISAYAKATLLCGPTASTTSAIVIPDSSELEAGSEKGRGNLFILEKYGRYVHTENVSAEGTDKKTIFIVHCLKQKCPLGLGRKEKNYICELTCSWQHEGRKTDSTFGNNFTFGDVTPRSWNYHLHL